MPRPSRRRGRGTRAAVTVAGTVLVMASASGCFAPRQIFSSQPGVIGPVHVNAKGCVSQAGNVDCYSNSGVFPVPAPGAGAQLMVAVDVESTADLPDAHPVGEGRVWQTTLRRNASYEAQMRALRPLAQGRKWVGYVSDVIANWQPGATEEVSVPVTRAPLPDGSPNPAEFDAGLVLGGRAVTAELPAGRPVVCDLATAGTVCIDHHFPQGRSLLWFPVGERDLRLVTPAPVAVAPGGTAVIPVTARFKGAAAPQATFTLRARTKLPGGVATMNVPTLAPPSDSTSEVSASVQVPANATPGEYGVTVTAEIGATGQSRSTTAVLVVTSPGAGAPGPVAVDPLTLRVAARRAVPAWRVPSAGLPVTVTTGRATTAVITLSQVRRVRVRGRLVPRFVVIARRTAAVGAPSTRVVFRSRKLRPGAVRVVVSAEGVQARAATTLR